MTEESFEEKIIKSLYQGIKILYPKSKCNIEKCENNNFSCCNNDAYLLANNIHEQTISGKIYHYLDKFLERDLGSLDLSIDIEFNKHMSSGEHSEKTVICNSNTNCDLKDKICNEINEYRPDIILHKRGTDANNILIIECKKAQSIRGEKIKNDLKKLKAFTCDNGNFKYNIGVSIAFNKTKPIFTYFINKTQLGETLTKRIIRLLKKQKNDKCVIKMYKNDINEINHNEPSILNHILDIGEIE